MVNCFIASLQSHLFCFLNSKSFQGGESLQNVKRKKEREEGGKVGGKKGKWEGRRKREEKEREKK